MTDSIDLDDVDVDGADDETEESEANYGDWLWRGEGDPEDEPEPASDAAPGGPTTDDVDNDAGDDAARPESASRSASESEDEHEHENEDEEESPTHRGSPGVPATSEGPVGVPENQGGAGGGRQSRAGGPSPDDPATTQGGSATAHGEDVSEMTMTFTYDAIRRVADVQVAVSDARGWTDWIGVVGDVPTPTLRKLQREEYVDLDFFGGSETGPGQRLAEVDRNSMFFAERMLVVGLPYEEWIAEEAGWEFVPLEDAAEKAGWELEGDSDTGAGSESRPGDETLDG